MSDPLKTGPEKNNTPQKDTSIDPLLELENTENPSENPSEMIIGDISSIIDAQVEDSQESESLGNTTTTGGQNIIDINISSVDDLYTILLENDYDFVTIEPRDKDVELCFKKEKVDKEKRYLSFPIYTKILLKVKAASKVIIEETQVAQEGKAEIQIKADKYTLLSKTLPSNFGEKLFIKLKKIDRSVGKGKAQKASVGKLLLFLLVLGIVCLIIGGAFLSFIVINAKTLEDVQFFQTLGINLNEINLFIKKTTNIIFSVVLFIQTVLLGFYLFKAILTKKIYKVKKIGYTIVSFMLFIVLFGSAFAWLTISKKIENLPNWQEMSYGEVQIFDNSKLTNKDLFDKRTALIEDTSSLIGPITLKYDISNWAKKEESQGFTIKKYTWTFGGETQEEVSPETIYKFSDEGSYEVSVKVTGIDQKGDSIDKIIQNVQSVNISHIVNITENILESGGKTVQFDASDLKELGKIEWYFLGDGSESTASPSFIGYNFQYSDILLEDAMFGMYIQRVGKENKVLDKIFIINKEVKNSIEGDIIYNQDPVDNLLYTFKVKDPSTGNGNGFIEKFTWKIGNDVITNQSNLENVENSSTLSYSFKEYGEHNISVELEDSAGKIRTLKAKVIIDKKLQLKNSLNFSDNGGVIEAESYDPKNNEYIINNLPADNTLTIDARNIRASSTLYSLDSVSWDINADGNIDKNGQILQFPVHVAGNYQVEATYRFSHRKINGETSILKEKIFIESSTRQESIRLKVTPERNYVPTNVSFDASQSKIIGKNIEKFIYDYGDGQTEERDAINPAHKYTLPGTYKITLTVITTDGEKYTTSKQLVLKPQPQKAKIISSMIQAPISQGIDFFSEESEGQIISYFWEFGDGLVSTDANPTHSYDIAGQYKVKLTVAFKNSNSLTDIVNIKITDD